MCNFRKLNCLTNVVILFANFCNIISYLSRMDSLPPPSATEKKMAPWGYKVNVMCMSRESRKRKDKSSMMKYYNLNESPSLSPFYFVLDIFVIVLTINPLFPVPEVTSLHINCGGNQTTIGGITYDEDIYPAGPAVYKQIGNNWALSNTGLFMDNDSLPQGQLPPYTTKNETRLDMTNAELYKNARVSPMSLSYYGFCLANGVYTVKLHFAEIMFTDDNTYSDLGRRVFDVYIQVRHFNQIVTSLVRIVI